MLIFECVLHFFFKDIVLKALKILFVEKNRPVVDWWVDWWFGKSHHLQRDTFEINYKNWKSLLGWPKQFQFPCVRHAFVRTQILTPWDLLSFFDPMGWNASPFFTTICESIFWSTFSIRIEFPRKIQALNSPKPQEKTHFVLCRLSQLATNPDDSGFRRSPCQAADNGKSGEVGDPGWVGFGIFLSQR